jgi:tetratricopeptide (TPR) repeat protein
MKRQGCIAGFFLMISILLHADPVSLVALARNHQADENWFTAIENYQEALRENPSFLLAWHGMAECFYALGEYDQALSHVDEALRLRKDDPELMNLKGFISIGRGEIAEASELFSKVLSAWPNDIEARFGLAEIELHTGRISSASGLYREALARNPDNRKALLSLALLSQESGNRAAARDYLEKALQYHGENPQVFYFAAYIAILDGRTDEAERQVRRALSLKKNYDEARELLAVILYRSRRYSEVISVCDERIADKRNRSSAWYMKTLALEKLGIREDALVSARTGLEVAPEDDILRSLTEMIIIDGLPFEDSRRRVWSAWHGERAKLFEQKNLSDQALYEYRRALKLYPDDAETRYSYARVLLSRGYPAQFYSQLEFIQSLGKSTTTINDALESYGRLLSTSVHRTWNIDPLYLDKAHTSIGLFYRNDPANVMHPDSERITASMLAQAFSYNPRFVVHEAKSPVQSYSEAFRLSRERGDDYFIMLHYNENDRDVRLVADVHVSSTGTKADSFSVFRTGNDRYPNALRRMTQVLVSSFPLRGTLLKRLQGDAVIDLGRADGVNKDAVFDIVDARKLRTAGGEIALVYEKDAVLGTFTVTVPDEELSGGTVTRSGFYDRINSGDAVVLVPEKDEAADQTDQEPEQKTSPALFKLVRQIR